MSLLAYIIMWINVPLNAAGKFLLAPIALLPGWLSNTIIAAITGVILLMVFKHTSNQKAIGRIKDAIKADMLTLKLFKDSFLVTLQAQGRLFKGAFLLLCYSVVPLLVMIVPVSLLLGQMGLWYQAMPLNLGEEAVVTMKLNEDKMKLTPDTEKQGPNIVELDNQKLYWPQVSIGPSAAAEVIVGPVRSFSTKEICWKIKARENGYHHIVFHVDRQKIEKQLAIGDGFMRVSTQRPGWHWADVLLNPAEKPFRPDSLVQSISIDYPERHSWTSGTNWWLIYFFIASMVLALFFKPFLKVKI